MEGRVWLLPDTTQGPSIIGWEWAALNETKHQLPLAPGQAGPSMYSIPGSAPPDSWAFSRTGLSAAETPPRGPEICLLRQSKYAQERGRKSLVPSFPRF